MVAANSGVPLWIVALTTWDTRASNSAIRAAQAAVVNHTTIFGGPDLDTLVGTVCSGSACRQAADNTHFTGNGSDSAATLWESVIAARTWPQVFRAALFTSSTMVQIARVIAELEARGVRCGPISAHRREARTP